VSVQFVLEQRQQIGLGTRRRAEIRIAEQLKILAVNRLVLLHGGQKSRIVHHFGTHMAGAQEAAGLAHVMRVLGHHGMCIAECRMKVGEQSTTRFAAHPPLPGVFEQRLAFDEPERSLFQHRDLSLPEARDRHDAHQAGVLIFPLLPDGRVLEHAGGDQLLLRVVAVQRAFDAIGRFAHQASET